MTSVENGAAEAANDTAESTVITQTADTTQANQDGADQGDTEELDEAGNPVERQAAEPEWAEIEIDGKKYRVEAGAKDGFLRQSDYTKKTQEVAEARRALDADREGFKAQTEAQKTHFKLATKLAALDEQLEPYVKYSPQDWMNLRASDPDGYESHRLNFDFLKNQRDTVARDFSQKEQDRQGNEQRATAKRVADAYTAIERHVPAWKPNSEFETKIFSYGNAQGYKTDVLAQAIIQEPLFARDLARLQAYDVAAAKQKTQQTLEKTLEVKPVTRVGGNGSGNTIRTTDASGDKLSPEEWAKRERERTAPKQARR